MTAPIYLEGLTYGSQDALPETRAGLPMYAGSAHRLKEWKFKIQNRVRNYAAMSDDEQKKIKMAKLLTSIIDALSDDALKIAMDMTESELDDDSAIQTLMDRVEANCAKYKPDQHRELLRAGHKTTGVLCRQPGETIISYISRRIRWYKRVCSLAARPSPTTSCRTCWSIAL